MKVTESRVERRRQEARRRILSVARELFVVEGGFEKSTIREIAERADVSVGAVYLHFKTKVDILEVLVSEHVGSLVDSVEAAVAEADSGRAKFEALIETFLRWRLDSEMQLFAQLLLRQGKRDRIESSAESLSYDPGRIIQMITESLTLGIADGSFPIAEDPQLVATIIFQFLSGMIILDLLSKEMDIGINPQQSAPEITETFKRLILRALGINNPDS